MKRLNPTPTQISDWLSNIDKLVINYLKENSNRDQPVVEYESGSELKQKLNLELGIEAKDDQVLLQDIANYLKHSVRTGHPHFHNQLYGGFNLWAYLGEVITALTSTSMATFEVAPVATLMEQVLVDKMSALVGFRDVGERAEGIMLTGGSNANLVAMLAARNILYPNSKTDGAPGDLVAFCSEEAHYSFSKAANIMGLGTRNLWAVATDDKAKMDPIALANRIKEAKELGLKPFFVGATAGTTVKGAFDPFFEIAHICKSEGIWFHVDGAWGGSVALSPTHKNLLNGAELADSFTWDAHKLMHIPLIASFILFKKEGVLRQSHSGGGDTYIFHDYDNKEWDSGPHSLQCGRRVDSLKLWLSWRALGDEAYAQMINSYMDIAEKLEKEIHLRENFELMFEREFLNICFRVIPPKGVSAREFNLKLRSKVAKHGRYMVNFSWQKDEPFFRMVIANPQSSLEDYISFLDYLNECRD